MLRVVESIDTVRFEVLPILAMALRLLANMWLTAGHYYTFEPQVKKTSLNYQ
jgi:hypothetical protein